jgi:hypothetical protein
MAIAGQPNDPSVHRDPLTSKVIGAAIEVHRTLGPGLLESAHSECLAHEFVTAQNFLMEGTLIVEVKCVEKFDPAHEAQLLTCMRMKNAETGLLLYFRSLRLKDGIIRRKLFSSANSVPSVLLASPSV